MLLIAGALAAGCGESSSWEVEHRVEIAASPKVVWRLLTELERYGEWNPYSPHVTGTLRVGEIVRVEAHLRDEVRQVDNLVITLDPERTLCWRSQNWYRVLSQGTRCRHLEALPDGRTRLRHHERMHGPLAWLIERLYRERIEEGIRLADTSLKHAAEAFE